MVTTATRARTATRTTARKPATTARRATQAVKAEEGVIMVKGASLPGTVRDVALKASAATVEQALRAFGMHVDQARDVRVNNVPTKANDKTPLREGSFVTVVGQVNGGC